MNKNNIQSLLQYSNHPEQSIKEKDLTGKPHPFKPSFLLGVLYLLLLVACSQPQSSLKNDVPVDIQPKALFASVTPAPTQNTIIRTASDSDTLLGELRNLVIQRQVELFSKPGWLHLLTRHINPTPNQQASWEAAPAQFEQEEWILINDQGQLIQAVNRIKNSDGQILRAKESILSDGIWHNLTLGSESQAGPTEIYLSDLGFYHKTLQLLEAGNHLSNQTIYHNCWYLGEEYRINDGDKLITALFNPDTGALRSLNIWDGSSAQITLVSSIEIVTKELIIAPPDDVITLLGSSYNR